MNQEELRTEVKKLKLFQNVTYKKIAERANIKPKSFHSWLRQEFSFGQEKIKNVETAITEFKKEL